jgi:hypothetical protein
MTYCPQQSVKKSLRVFLDLFFDAGFGKLQTYNLSSVRNIQWDIRENLRELFEGPATARWAHFRSGPIKVMVEAIDVSPKRTT